MKKRSIFYILFAFFIMFGLKSNVFAERLDCYYQNDNNPGVIWYFYRANGNWEGRRVREEETGIKRFYGTYETEKSDKIKFDADDECPNKVYFTAKGFDYWTTNSSTKKIRESFTLIQLNTRYCTYHNGNTILQLIQQPYGGSFFTIKMVRDNGEIVPTEKETVATMKNNEMFFSLMRGTDVAINGNEQGDSCPSNIYSINLNSTYDNDPLYWSEDKDFNGLGENSMYTYTEYTLNSREDFGEGIEEGASNATARYCVYSLGTSEYLLRQEADYSVELYKLTDSSLVPQVLYSFNNDSSVKSELLTFCPNKLYMSNDSTPKFSTSPESFQSGKLANTLKRVESAACGTSVTKTNRGTPTNIFIKTANNYYAYSGSGANAFDGNNNSIQYDNSLKNYTNFSAEDNDPTTVCGKVKIGGHDSWTTLSIQEKLSEEVSCKYDIDDNTSFYIKSDISTKNFSVDASKVSYCSENNESNKVDISGIKFSDVINSNDDCNSATKFKLENISGTKKCKLVISSDGYQANMSDYIEDKQSKENNYSAMVYGDGATSYSDTKYATYKPVCGIFKSEELGGKLFPIIKNLYRLLKIALPLLVLVLTVVEFLKVLFSGEDKTMKDAFKATTTRFILIIVIVLLPILVEFIIRITGMSENCLQHFL